MSLVFSLSSLLSGRRNGWLLRGVDCDPVNTLSWSRLLIWCTKHQILLNDFFVGCQSSPKHHIRSSIPTIYPFPFTPASTFHRNLPYFGDASFGDDDHKGAYMHTSPFSFVLAVTVFRRSIFSWFTTTPFFEPSSIHGWSLEPSSGLRRCGRLGGFPFFRVTFATE